MANPYTLDFLKKCLDKDPAKRWSCDRLSVHPYFDDYKLKCKELETENEDDSKQREKAKSSNTSLPHLTTPGTQESIKPKQSMLRSEHHLPTI